MYHLRQLVREGEVSDQGLVSAELGPGGDLESFADEVLQSECPEDGQTLLMYAAAQGNEACFGRLVGDIRSRVSVVSNSWNASASLRFSATPPRKNK